MYVCSNLFMTNTYIICLIINDTYFNISLALVNVVITSGPINVTVCSGTKAKISCGYTGVSDPFNTKPNWRIFKRNNNGSVISNETVSGMDVHHNKIDDLKFIIVTRGSNNNADGSYLSVGPVDDTYNNTSYQCIFTINDNIIESDTAGTITVVGRCMHMVKCDCLSKNPTCSHSN